MQTPARPLSRPGPFWAALALLSLVPPLTKLAFAPHYPGSDDAFIHLAVVRSLSRGEGWGIVPGHDVNMSSSPLFTLLLWGMQTIGLGGIGWGQVISVVFASSGVAFVGLGALYATRSRPLALTAAVLAAFNVNLWRWNGTVMETTLAYLVTAAVVALAYRAAQPPSGGLPSRRLVLLLGLTSGVAVLIRYELALFPALLLLWLLAKRAPTRLVVAFLAGSVPPVLAWEAVARQLFGGWLPTTYYAKAGSWHIVNIPVGRSFVLVLGTSCLVPIVILVAALAAMIVRRSRPRLVHFVTLNGVAIAFCLAFFLFYYVRTDALQSAGRYVLPMTAVLPVLAVSAVAHLREPSPDGSLRATRGLLALCAAGALVQAVFAAALFATKVEPVLNEFNSNYKTTMTDVAHYLDRSCGRGQVALIVKDIGVISHEKHGGCAIADGGALASPELRGLTTAEQVRASHASIVVQTLGSSAGALRTDVPDLQLVWSRRFEGHGLSGAPTYVASIYRVTRP